MRERDLFIKLIRELSFPLEPLPVPLDPEWEALVPGSGPGARPVLEGIKAVLFDLYGTLFISAAGEIAADPESSAGEGAMAAMGTYFRQAVGERHRAARDAGTAWPEVAVEEIWAEYRGVFPGGKAGMSPRELALRYELAVNPVYPMPHALETLTALARRGLTLGIISNAQFFSPLLFDAFFGAPPEKLGFDPDLLVYSFREGEAKPSSRLFSKARELLVRRGIKAAETLYAGNDMRNDMVPAADAGFTAALFAGDRRSLRLRQDDPACAGRRPLLVLKDLQELLRGR
ncbi:MAG: HAD family hydrolase [Treponema sp.]|jgi:putative hydrolase of the HAD superfamily|nr:HAD family hydrolase [Treponema sp.]